MEISNLPNKEFKVMIINMLNELRRMDEHSEKFNKELQNIKNWTVMKDTITEMKNTPEGINNRLNEGIPWQSSGYDSMLPLQGAQVQSLVRELRACKPCGQKKK